MELKQVRILRARSIRDARLEDCGRLNVLIGRNNSGKSNVMTAIRAFFETIESGQIASLNPVFGMEIDFHNRDITKPIEVSVSFALTEHESAELLASLADDAPQMKNVIDTFEKQLVVEVTVSFLSEVTLGYVSRISVSSDRKSDGKKSTARVVLEIGREAAIELHDRMSRSRRGVQESKSLPQFLDEEWWTRMRQEREARNARQAYRYFGPRAFRELGQESTRALENLLAESETYSDYESGVRSLIAKMKEEADVIERAPLESKIRTLAGEDTTIPGHVLKLVKRISEIRILHLAERRRPIGRDEAEKLLSLKVRRGGDEQLRTIRETVNALLGVEIDAFESVSEQRPDRKSAEMDVEGFLVEVNGAGIREALRLVLDVEFRAPNVLLVEEPEVHLHPGLEAGMMRYLKNLGNRVQVFVSTHSTNFLDTSDMKNVYLISKSDETKVERIDLERAEVLIPRELGLRLSSLFMFDKLVFVEGPSDELILREWCSKLGVNLGQSNVGFVAMGGSRKILFFANKVITEFLSRRRVRLLFILDHDEMTDVEIDALKSLVGRDAIVHVLTRRDLENYLIVPRALAEVIRERGLHGNNTQEVSDATVSKALDECALALRELAVAKRVFRPLSHPIYLSLDVGKNPSREQLLRIMADAFKNGVVDLEKRAAKVAADYAQCDKVVEESWASSRFEIVPGETLIDCLFQVYSRRYGKMTDGPRIAQLMRKDEIPDELQRVLTSLAG